MVYIRFSPVLIRRFFRALVVALALLFPVMVSTQDA